MNGNRSKGRVIYKAFEQKLVVALSIAGAYRHAIPQDDGIASLLLLVHLPAQFFLISHSSASNGIASQAASNQQTQSFEAAQ